MSDDISMTFKRHEWTHFHSLCMKDSIRCMDPETASMDDDLAKTMRNILNNRKEALHVKSR